ncbi:MAG: IS200/IS605 family transposase [Calditrichaceae bacterium]
MMSKRTHTACYIHLIWGVKDRAPLLSSNEVQKKVNHYFQNYLNELEINLIGLHTNSDHVHLLIELPLNRTIQDIVKLLKGSSSHWINQNDIIKMKFAWAVGYAAFTVSKSNVSKVKRYILNQKEHHREATFTQEYEKFIANR